MKKPMYFRYVILLISLPLCAADSADKGLINLARLEIARVSASSNNQQIFQIRDAFDGDAPLSNGNCRSWIAKPHSKDDIDEWVNVRFLAPIAVHQIRIVGERSVVIYGSPAELTVKTASFVLTTTDESGRDQIKEIAPVEFENDMVVLSLTQPLVNVKNVRINFEAATAHPVMVREIEVLGLAPGIKDKTVVTPRIDGQAPEEYWNDLDTLSFYDPPQNLPARRFVVTEKKAVIVDKANTILQTFTVGPEDIAEKLEGNRYKRQMLNRVASLSRDKSFILIVKYEWDWEEDRDREEESFEPAEPDRVEAYIYDLQGKKVYRQVIESPTSQNYCIQTSSHSLGIVACGM